MLINSASAMQYQAVQQQSKPQAPSSGMDGMKAGAYEDKVTLSSSSELNHYERAKHIDLQRIETARNDPNFALDEAKDWASSTGLKEVFFQQHADGDVTELYSDGSAVQNMQSQRYQQHRLDHESFTVQAKQERQERMAFVDSAVAEGMEPFEIFKTIRQDYWKNWPAEAGE
jgi:hypothetical protein